MIPNQKLHMSVINKILTNLMIDPLLPVMFSIYALCFIIFLITFINQKNINKIFITNYIIMLLTFIFIISAAIFQTTAWNSVKDYQISEIVKIENSQNNFLKNTVFNKKYAIITDSYDLKKTKKVRIINTATINEDSMIEYKQIGHYIVITSVMDYD